jgi:HPt (histidine-containing phosphotransfer) domain-containing protein
MKQRYLERRQADVTLLVDAISRKDFETLMRIGHQIKGNAATFGYMDLEELAKDLESSGRAANILDAHRLVEKLAEWLLSQNTKH